MTSSPQRILCATIDPFKFLHARSETYSSSGESGPVPVTKFTRVSRRSQDQSQSPRRLRSLLRASGSATCMSFNDVTPFISCRAISPNPVLPISGTLMWRAPESQNVADERRRGVIEIGTHMSPP